MWMQQNPVQHVCKSHVRIVADRAVELLWVAVVFLLSELLIWALHLVLRRAGIEFLSSILGMILVFIAMVILNWCLRGTNDFYTRKIKPKVDFLNKNMGLGFAVPLVAIGNQDVLDGEDIGKVIGTFLTTNAIFWGLVFMMALGLAVACFMLPGSRLLSHQKWDLEQPDSRSSWVPEDPPRLVLPDRVFDRGLPDAITLRNEAIGYQIDKEAIFSLDSRTASVYLTDSECPTPMPRLCPRQPPLTQSPPPLSARVALPSMMVTCYPIFLSVFFIIALGIPASLIAGDDHILDGCMLWFVWITSTRLQRTLSAHSLSSAPSRPAALSNTKRAVTTLLNPVLLTTLGMTAYTRAKASATSTPLTDILGRFSSGTSLSELWSFLADPAAYPLKHAHLANFGAGDAALAVLEVGIVVWGFKLFECRRQLASRAGLSVVVASAVTAAINVFLSSLLGKGIGLAAPEALAFAARSTTLALARPAVEALGGNLVVNAALVVSNGILGQVMYPFVLGRLGLDKVECQPRTEHERHAENATDRCDEARVIAAGTSIGINGAAMGVAYLYEQKNRAAPYAVLSMTVFGVMTVVFTAVEPFTSTLALLMRG